MKDFIRTTLSTSLDQEEIYPIVKKELPDYVWRMGDSDSQGEYISGNGEGQIQIWLGWQPADVTISLRAVSQTREWKDKLIHKVLNETLPLIGKLGRVNEND